MGYEIHRTRRYDRIRIRSPKQFRKSSFRILDIGKPGKHKLIRGRTKRTGEYKTQAVLAPKSQAHTTMTKSIIKKAKEY